jgi:hypothetical protein
VHIVHIVHIKCTRGPVIVHKFSKLKY